MDLRDTPEEAAFRAEVRAWLEANLPTELSGPRSSEERVRACLARLEPQARRRRLRRADLAEGVRRRRRAVLAPGDPARGARRAPRRRGHIGVIGLGMAGPTIIAHGTDEQKARYLAEDPLGRGDLVPGLLRAGRRLRPRRRADARRAATATTSSSTARRSGRRTRTSPTGASSSRAATPSRSARRA